MKIKKGLKKTLASLLVALLVLSAAPFASVSETALADLADKLSLTARAVNVSDIRPGSRVTIDKITYYIDTSSRAWVTGCDESISGWVTVRSNIGGYPVIRIGNEAFRNRPNITNFSLPATIVLINNDAFVGTGYYNDSSNWENGVLYIGDYLIEAKHTVSGDYTVRKYTRLIADYAFADCKDIKSVSFPEELEYISQYAFRNCSGLESLTIPDGVKRISMSAFSGCSGIKSINLGQGLSTINEGVFSGCTSLTEVNIPDNITRIEYRAFQNCTALTAVKFGKGVSTIQSGVFGGCNALTLLTVDPENTAMHSENNCVINTSDKVLVLGCNTSRIPTDGSVIRIGVSAFFSCSGLKYVEIPDSVTSIGANAFDGCTGLSYVAVGKNLKTVGAYAFRNCRFESFAFPDGLTSIGESAFQNSSIEFVSFPKSLTSIGNNAFKDCTRIEKLAIPTTVNSVGDNAFDGCTSLKSVTVGENVASIGTKALGYYNNGSNKIDGFTIYGFAGSVAETYATANGFNFVRHTHSFNSKITKKASCTEVGEKILACECGESTAQEIPKLAHTSSDWITDVPAACTTAGTRHKECTVCKQTLETEAVPATGHTASDWIIDLPAACLADGSRHKECMACGTLLEEELIPKTGHNFEKANTPATCTSIGLDTEVCRNCGETRLIKTIPATGHTASDWIIDREADCKTVGSRHKECTVCKEIVETEVIPTTQHELETTTVEPTCVSIGYVTETCKNCGETHFVRALPALGHDWEETVGKKATCTENGMTAGAVCKNCGEKKSSETIPATGHTASEWIIDKDADCKTVGSKHKECTVCGEIIETQVIPASEHKFATKTVEPSCVSVGYETMICENCGESRFVREIVALGHVDEDGDGKCDRCGEALKTPDEPTQPSDPFADCSCACHKTGVAKFFFKIILFFQKLFGQNKVCKCGALHY